MADSLIFVSCGQLTEAEKRLGAEIKAAIDQTPGFTSYFAESVQELESGSRKDCSFIQIAKGSGTPSIVLQQPLPLTT